MLYDEAAVESDPPWCQQSYVTVTDYYHGL